MTSTPMHILGSIANFTQRQPSTPLEMAHQEGLVFVAMDARDHAAFRGGTPAGEWIVARKLRAELPLDPWPDTGWRFQDEAAARNAYQTMRQHVMASLPGIEPRDARDPDRKLVDPNRAWGEAFYWQGEEVLFLSCDPTTEARILQMTTQQLGAFKVASTGARGASYSSQVAHHAVAIASGQDGYVDHLLAAFSPARESALIAGGLAGSELDTKPFDLEVPSGILVVAWARADGSEWRAHDPQADPAATIANMIGNAVAGPLTTSFDDPSVGPYAWGIRVRPGTFRCALRFLETEHGISAMALSHTQAPPLWPDMGGAQVAFGAQAPFGAAAGGQAGDPDPVMFPGQPLARLSDYVNLMMNMQSGDMDGALRTAGLDMAGYGRAAQDWGVKMAADPSLGARFTALMTERSNARG